MCYVHAIHPLLCNHSYYLLTISCSPTTTLLTCPARAPNITVHRRILNGLCPRCNPDSQGYDPGRIMFREGEGEEGKEKSRSNKMWKWKWTEGEKEALFVLSWRARRRKEREARERERKTREARREGTGVGWMRNAAIDQGQMERYAAESMLNRGFVRIHNALEANSATTRIDCEWEATMTDPNWPFIQHTTVTTDFATNEYETAIGINGPRELMDTSGNGPGHRTNTTNDYLHGITLKIAEDSRTTPTPGLAPGLISPSSSPSSSSPWHNHCLKLQRKFKLPTWFHHNHGQDNKHDNMQTTLQSSTRMSPQKNYSNKQKPHDNEPQPYHRRHKRFANIIREAVLAIHESSPYSSSCKTDPKFKVDNTPKSSAREGHRVRDILKTALREVVDGVVTTSKGLARVGRSMSCESGSSLPVDSSTSRSYRNWPMLDSESGRKPRKRRGSDTWSYGS